MTDQLTPTEIIEASNQKLTSEVVYQPTTLDDLVSTLEDNGVNFGTFKDDPDSGPARFFEELKSGKNQLILTSGENGEKQAIRKSRVFRAQVVAVVGDKEYEIRQTKKIRKKDGSEAPLSEDERTYSSSKGLLNNQEPQHVIESVVKEDLGQDATVINPEFVNRTTQRKSGNGSKMPWIDSEYEFATYRITVSLPESAVNEPIISEGRTFTTVREAFPIE